MQTKVSHFNEKLAKRGVVHMSSVPPYMQPDHVKQLLEQHGEVTRIYLVEEDAAIARRRKKMSGNRKKNYTEGWIEFADKKKAKAIAMSFNGTKLGGKKRGFYTEDIWNLKYLRHFNWSHLTEKKAYERRVQKHKLRLEMITAKKQNAEFLELVEKKKMIMSIQSRKRGATKELANCDDSEATSEKNLHQIRRRFRQKKPIEVSGDQRVLESSTLDGLMSRD